VSPVGQVTEVLQQKLTQGKLRPGQGEPPFVIPGFTQLRLEERQALLDIERLRPQPFEIEMPVAPDFL